MHKIKIIHRILVDNLKIKNTGLKKEAIQPRMIIKSFNCYNLFFSAFMFIFHINKYRHKGGNICIR